jgi:transcription antitermination factor NusG
VAPDEEYAQGPGFSVAAAGRPVPITDAEANRILKQVQEGIERPKPSVMFEIGEQVKVSDGPFASFNGIVEEIRRGKAAAEGVGLDLWVATPVELDSDKSTKSEKDLARRHCGRGAHDGLAVRAGLSPLVSGRK